MEIIRHSMMGKFLGRREPNCVLTIKLQKKKRKSKKRRKSSAPLSHLQPFHPCCIFISHAALRLMVKAVKMKRLPN